jgi:RNA polymerase sigma-70 factor (ECF subfamily)
MRSDDDLIGAFRAGDGLAMEALFRRYRKPVFAWLLRTAPDRTEAEDLYQEAWLKVVRGIDGYTSGGFKAWLWRIVRNTAVDRARKKTAAPMLDEPMSDEQDAESRVDQLADEKAVSALERMEAEERRSLLRRAVEGLSARLKDVVLLRIHGELEFREIAEMLGLPLGTVLGRMNLAVRKLREAVGELKG